MLLGLDIATTTGWCAGTGACTPDFGHVDLAPTINGSRGKRFSEFNVFLRRLIRKYQPTHVLGERPILPKPFFKGRTLIWPTSIEVTSVLQGLSAVAEMVCFDAGVPYEFVNVKEVKKELTGRGDATKEQMVDVARRAGLNVAVHDEADGIAVWLYGVRKHAKQHSEAWDRRIYSHGRGGLL